jgi:hypothetical protein
MTDERKERTNPDAGMAESRDKAHRGDNNLSKETALNA